MKWNEVFRNTFKELNKQIEPDVRKQIDFMLPSMPMVEACRADDFDFFHPFIDAGKLTMEQMRHATARYCLGKTRSGQPIFWMMDDMRSPLDAHIGDTWMSKYLKQREPLLKYWQVTHCLFGLHLLSEDDKSPVCIVESESSAVVLSELFPESIWMAYATPTHLVPDLFAPLEDRMVIIYPSTDPTLSNYLFFQDLADLTLKTCGIALTIDTTLEDHATDDQKARCIDILDFLQESIQNQS